MRRILEDPGRRIIDRDGVGLGENERDGLPGFLQIEDGGGRRVQGDEVIAGSDRARHAEMSLDEVWLVGHIAVDVVPTVFPRDGMEQVERRIVVMRLPGRTDR